ncbi:MAG: hypothetical protein R3B97_12980 [Dehalococcoidia bacterium]|nr:hypothetical protein [Dehalococcoidia bacterium]MCA9829927.1 hypothetical protein [Dehalococcoidia bacterium]
MKIQHFYGRQDGRTAKADAELAQALEATGLDGSVVEYIEVTDSEDAKAKRFLGNPTIRVNGLDVEYGDREPDEYQAGMRYYNTAEGWKPFPHARLIANVIIEQQAKEAKS